MGTLKHQFLKLRVSFRLVSLLKSMTCPSPFFSNILTLACYMIWVKQPKNTLPKTIGGNYQLGCVCKKNLEETVNNMSRTKSWSKKWWFIHGTIRKKITLMHPKNKSKSNLHLFFLWNLTHLFFEGSSWVTGEKPNRFAGIKSHS